MNIQNKIKKLIIIITLAVTVTVQNGVVSYALAEEMTPTPTEQQQPALPSEPTPPPEPTPPEPPATPTPPTAPTAPTPPSDSASITQATGEQTSANGNVGDTSIQTGDSSGSTTAVSQGNANTNTSGKSGSESATVSNTNNGVNSQNTPNTTTENTSTATQSNSASVISNLNSGQTTGGTSASFNVGNSSISTGNANTSGTVISAVNTNVDGVAVAEFNIIDDHYGDIILDFNAGCAAGCNSSPLTVNNGNGANSTNTAAGTTIDDSSSFQSNDATIGSNLTLDANSGNNTASYNTGGDSTITTGDANIQASTVTFANNNIIGNIVYSVVNIFGNLVGDIIIPESAITSACTTCGGTTVANTDNGAGSQNTATANTNTSTTTDQFNTANIDNTLTIDTNTGGNEANFNTNGNSTVTTGDTNILANVLNIANTNIDGGTFWLVIVNQAGNWIGKILGAPDGQNFAGSPLFEFLVGDNGEITATNSGNGANSDNTANSTQTTNSESTQTNTAHIQNNLNLSAHTGNNQANYNTGGNSTIQTGDANIIANIVNFVNNNIIEDGKLVVTVVNVFGSWVGDLVTPGQKKQPKPSSSKDTTYDNTVKDHDKKTPETQQSDSQPILSSHQINSNSDTSLGIKPNASPDSNKTESRKYSTPFQSSVRTEGQALVASAQQNVAGAQSIASPAENISINLAWLLIALPLGLVSLRLIQRLKKSENGL